MTVRTPSSDISRVPTPRAGHGGERHRVLIATDTYPPDVNGAANFTHRFAAALAGQGHEVAVICPSETGEPHRTRRDGVTQFRLRSVPVLLHPTMRVAVPLGAAGAAARLIDGFRPDVVHAQGHFTLGRATLTAARRARVPVVLTNHFMPDNLYDHGRIPPAMRAAAGRWAWRDFVRVALRADYVTTPTPRAAELLVANGLDRPVDAISCGIDLARFHPRPAERAAARHTLGVPDRPTILFVGRLDAEKRIEELLLALPRLLNHVDAQLVLAGSGRRESDLRGLADALGVADRVRFLGYVPDEHLSLTYVAADMFAIASAAELQSIATLEAMASGLPVVAADAMALPHLVQSGRTGHLYPPGDVEALTGRLHDVLADTEERRRMGAAAREVALTHDIRHSLERFGEVYARLVAGRRRSPAHAM